MPRCSQRVVPLTGDPQGIPTNTPDQFPAQAEGLGGPCGTRGTPTPYGAIRASKNAQDHLNTTVTQYYYITLHRLTLFPRRDLGRDGDMRMVALRRSVHRGEW